MFFFLSKTLDLALSPLSWALLLLVVVVVVRGKKRERLARGAALGALLVLVVFSLNVVSNGLMRSLERRAPRTFREDVTYDAVLLLGGLVEDHPTEDWGAPSYSEASERLLVTYDLLRTGRARFAVPSAGPLDRHAKVVEAQVLADQLVAWGIAPDRVVVEARALNTRDNAVELARIARERGWKSLLVVTSAFHMPRAIGCFRAVDLPVDALPVDYRSFDASRHPLSWQPRVGHLSMSAVALRELAGGVVYRLRGFSR